MSSHTDYASLNLEEFDPLEVHPDQEPNGEDSPSAGSAKAGRMAEGRRHVRIFARSPVDQCCYLLSW